MRPIKFKAYYQNKWYYWYDARDREYILKFLLNPKTYVGVSIVQFTGLKNKKGKEIYEGDIVETNNPEGRTHFVIEFEEDSGGSLGAFNANHIKSFKKSGSESSVHCQVIDDCEVIGNIYENPELLGEKG